MSDVETTYASWSLLTENGNSSAPRAYAVNGRVFLHMLLNGTRQKEKFLIDWECNHAEAYLTVRALTLNAEECSARRPTPQP